MIIFQTYSLYFAKMQLLKTIKHLFVLFQIFHTASPKMLYIKTKEWLKTPRVVSC